MPKTLSPGYSITIFNRTLMLCIGMMAWAFLVIPSAAEEKLNTDYQFPSENFTPITPTLPNQQLNFDDDSQESCCAKDVHSTTTRSKASLSSSAGSPSSPTTLVHSEFERANPRYMENSTPPYLISCDRFATLPEMASNMPPSSPGYSNSSLPIVSYSTNISLRPGASYVTNPGKEHTSDFHIEVAGGNSQLQLQGVSNYSICMARGNNVTVVDNTDSASILSYGGSDHVYLTGNNTNMFTRTGAGEDLIELYQTAPSKEVPNTYTAFNIYKTAISGGSETDTLVIKESPVGTKWCHIGGYRIFGEYFYVVEFALPPSVTEGPRRQRVNIGESVEFVVIKGKKYRLNDFLVHGEPMDTVARQIPLGDALPYVAVRQNPGYSHFH